jgi:hypothetical protein
MGVCIFELILFTKESKVKVHLKHKIEFIELPLYLAPHNFHYSDDGSCMALWKHSKVNGDWHVH